MSYMRSVWIAPGRRVIRLAMDDSVQERLPQCNFDINFRDFSIRNVLIKRIR
jgi:hypothetical protein